MYDDQSTYGDERIFNIPGFPGGGSPFGGPPGQQDGGPGGGPPFGGQGGGPPFGGPPGQSGGGPGGFPGGGQSFGAPTSAPPSFTPTQPQTLQSQGFGVYAVDPGAIRRCLFQFTYIWLRWDAFWFFPIFLGRNSIAGFRWYGNRWVYYGVDLDRIQSFQCY